MFNQKYFMLSLAALLILGTSQSAKADTPPPPQPEVLAPAPQMEPYGWWYSKTPTAFSRPANMSGRQEQKPGTGEKPSEAKAAGEAKEKPAETAADGKPKEEAGQTRQSQAALRASGHSFARNRSPIQIMYLAVKGAEMPESAPEVYYRFTARTLERHGGVALGSTIHKAEVKLEDGAWRADLFAPSFGTVEMYSRFKLGERYVYSQHNYLHYLPPEAAKDLKLPAQVEMPADWPQFVFPTSSYNDMPFRSVSAGQTVEFEIKGQADHKTPSAGVVLEENSESPISLAYNNLSQKFSYAPEEDLLLLEEGRRGSKKVLAMLTLPETEDVMTFSFNVSRSRWSTRKLGAGLGSIAAMGLITSTVVIRRRRRFKYNDRD